jgi:hypothetical protein
VFGEMQISAFAANSQLVIYVFRHNSSNVALQRTST